MKPTPTTNNTSRHLAETRISCATRKGPQLDYHFHASTISDFNGRCLGNRNSFRKISESYFRSEAKVSFIGEAILFGIIVLTVALPVLKAGAGVFEFVRAIAF